MNETNFAVIVICRNEIGLVARGFISDKRLVGMVVLVVQKRHPIIQQRSLKWLAFQPIYGVAGLETSAPDGAESHHIII